MTKVMASLSRVIKDIMMVSDIQLIANEKTVEFILDLYFTAANQILKT